MPFGGTVYQLAFAIIIGMVMAFRSAYSVSQAGALGAKVSFIIGAAFMLFSEMRWWPVTLSIVALVSWVVSGWLAAGLSYLLTTTMIRIIQFLAYLRANK